MTSFTFKLSPFVRTWDEDDIDNLVDMIDVAVAYWCSVPGEVATYPVLFVVEENEALDAGGVKRHNISMFTLEIGINRILSGECRVNTSCIGNIAAFIATNDTSYIDQEDMDLIIQAGVYGDIKWG